MPKASKPSVGSNDWKFAEARRFHELSRKHGGLTTPFWASLALRVSRQRIYQLIEAGILPSEEVGGKVYIRCDDLESFSVEERTNQTRYPVAA